MNDSEILWSLVTGVFAVLAVGAGSVAAYAIAKVIEIDKRLSLLENSDRIPVWLEKTVDRLNLHIDELKDTIQRLSIEIESLKNDRNSH